MVFQRFSPARGFFRNLSDFFFRPGSETTTFYCSEALASTFVEIFASLESARSGEESFAAVSVPPKVRASEVRKVYPMHGGTWCPTRGVHWLSDSLRKMLCEKCPPP